MYHNNEIIIQKPRSKRDCLSARAEFLGKLGKEWVMKPKLRLDLQRRLVHPTECLYSIPEASLCWI